MRFLFIIFFFLTSSAFADWDRAETANFVILTLQEERAQARYLVKNIESHKKDVMRRWGFPDLDFPKIRVDGILEPRCKIVCVSKKDIMKNLYGIDRTFGEIRYDDSGKIKQTLLFVIYEKNPLDEISPALTFVCLKELEEAKNLKFKAWVSRGMMVLNSSVAKVKTRFVDLETLAGSENLLSSKELFGMSEEKWKQKEEVKREAFDRQAAVVCLLLKKEFGKRNFILFTQTNGSAAYLNRIYGFKSHSQFDKTLKRYMIYLSRDIKEQKTPDFYLTP